LRIVVSRIVGLANAISRIGATLCARDFQSMISNTAAIGSIKIAVKYLLLPQIRGSQGVVKIARLIIVASLFSACGGATPPASLPKSHADDTQKSTSADTTVQEDQPRRSSRVQCDDGSCFACGEAVCLSGFYCSVGKAGHGCAWLPSCSGKPTCSCVTAAMREEPCTCEEKEGGIFVACDGAKL
jgi:hypothetical protein